MGTLAVHATLQTRGIADGQLHSPVGYTYFTRTDCYDYYDMEDRHGMLLVRSSMDAIFKGGNMRELLNATVSRCLVLRQVLLLPALDADTAQPFILQDIPHCRHEIAATDFIRQGAVWHFAPNVALSASRSD